MIENYAAQQATGRPGKACSLRYSMWVPKNSPTHFTSKERAVRSFKGVATYVRRHIQQELTAELVYDGKTTADFKLELGPLGGVQIARVAA